MTPTALVVIFAVGLLAVCLAGFAVQKLLKGYRIRAAEKLQPAPYRVPPLLEVGPTSSTDTVDFLRARDAIALLRSQAQDDLAEEVAKRLGPLLVGEKAQAKPKAPKRIEIDGGVVSQAEAERILFSERTATQQATALEASKNQ